MSLTPEWVRNQLNIMLREPVHVAGCGCVGTNYSIECVKLSIRQKGLAEKIVDMAKQCS